jgi:hypothetical protein
VRLVDAALRRFFTRFLHPFNFDLRFWREINWQMCEASLVWFVDDGFDGKKVN